MDIHTAKEPADQALEMSVVRLPGTLRRFLKGQLIGFLTAGLVEEDSHQPERFVVRVVDRRTGRVWGDIDAGDDPQTAQATLERFEGRGRSMTVREFLTEYHLRDKTPPPG